MEIWGSLEDGDFMPIEFDNTWGWEFTYDRVIDKAYPDRPGYKIKLEHEKYFFQEEERTGYRTLTWRRVFDEGGQLVLEEYTNMLLPNGQRKILLSARRDSTAIAERSSKRSAPTAVLSASS